MQRTLNLDAFLADLDKKRTRDLGLVRRIVQRVSLDCAENIIVGGKYAPGTPVDTGLARSSWHVQLNDRALPPARPHSVGAHVAWSGAVDKGTAALAGMGLGDVAYILNNLPYIKALEYGHSKQAPRGMVRITLGAAKQIVRAAIALERHRS